MSRELIVAADDEGWGVCDRDHVFENETPFQTREEARAFLRGIRTCQRRYAVLKYADWKDYPVEKKPFGVGPLDQPRPAQPSSPLMPASPPGVSNPPKPAWAPELSDPFLPPIHELITNNPTAFERQSEEFNALDRLADAWRTLRQIAPVDDDYLQHRQKYELALITFIVALYRNGRRWPAE